MSKPLFIFVLHTENNEIKLLCDICYFHYVKGILNDGSIKEYTNLMALINLKVTSTSKW